MATIKIVASDWDAKKFHDEALRENRTLSAMGLILLRESLDRRREQKAQTDAVRQLTEALRRPSHPDVAP